MANKIELPKDKELAKIIIDHDKTIAERNFELGFLGRIWGDIRNSPNNIAGLVLIALIIFGVAFSLWKANNIEDGSKLWSIITPIITLTLGYIFGARKSNNKE